MSKNNEENSKNDNSISSNTTRNQTANNLNFLNTSLDSNQISWWIFSNLKNNSCLSKKFNITNFKAISRITKTISSGPTTKADQTQAAIIMSSSTKPILHTRLGLGDLLATCFKRRNIDRPILARIDIGSTLSTVKSLRIN